MPGRITQADLRHRADADLPRGNLGALGGLGVEALDSLRAAGADALAAIDQPPRAARRRTVLAGMPATDSVGRLAHVIEGREQPDASVVVRLFDKTPDKAIAARQVEFIEALAVGTLAIATSPDFQPDGELDPRFDKLIDIGLSELPGDRLIRDILRGGGKPDPTGGGLDPRIPSKYLAEAERLRQKGCVNAAKRAVGELGATMGRSTPRYRPAHIEQLDPVDACPGDRMVITGTGFGLRDEAAVAFTGATGKAVLVHAGTRDVQWSDTQIELTVPRDARHGPVGILTVPKPAGNIGQLASTAVGEMGSCFGAAAMARAESLFGQMAAPSAMAPSRQADGKNVFIGGIPVVRWLSCSPSINLTPETTITLSWKVDGATSVEITRAHVGSDQHELPAIAGPLPAVGTVTVGPVPGNRRWKGAYVLTATNHCGTETRQLELTMSLKIGLALGGGGSRGDFQVGALRYLYDVKAIRPNAITATSVGAINAVELVMGDKPAGNGAARVEAQWRALVDDSSMWNYEPWLLQMSQAVRYIVRSLSWEGLLAFPYTLVMWIGQGGAVQDILNKFSGPNPPNAFYNIAPIEARMNGSFNPTDATKSGIELRLVAVSLETGELIHVNQNGNVLGKGSAGQSASVVAGAMASAAMPAIFPPVRIGDHMCVDGGVRDVVPVETAVKDLGCHVVYAIRLSAAPKQEPLNTGRNLAAIASRAVLSTTYDEVADNDVAPFRGWGPGVTVHIIESTFDIHDPTVVDPGLIDIGIDYGWMRAGDVLDVAPANQALARQLSDEITQLRVDNWELAHRALRPIKRARPRFGFSLPAFVPTEPSQVQSLPDRAVVEAIRQNSRLIRDKVVARLGIGAPCRPPVEDWFQKWETIPHLPWTNTPWDEYTADPQATLAAEAPPTL